MAKKKTATKTRNRAAQDATLINVRTLKRDVNNLKQSVMGLQMHVSKLYERVSDLEAANEKK